MTNYLQRPALAVLLTTALLQGHALAADAGRAQHFYEDALKRYEQRDYSGAEIQLKNALLADKNQLAVHLLLGKTMMANGEVANAEFEFGEALRLGVNRTEVALPLAQALIAEGKQANIFDDPRFALDGLPTDTRYRMLLLRSSASLDLGHADDAMTALRDARAIRPNDAASWIAEVPLRIRAGQLRDAQVAADQALRLAPGNAEALYQRATILHVSGQLPAALAAYSTVLKVDSGHLEARLARAGILLDLGRDKESQADVDEIQRLDPLDPRAAYLQALLAQRRGDDVGAKQALHAVTEFLDPVPLEFLRYRMQLLMVNGLAHFGLNDFEKAKPYLDMAWRLQPNSPLAKLLAQIALADKDTDRAIDLLDDYVKSNPADSQAMLMLASAYMSQGHYAQATLLMQQALQAKNAPTFHTVLGVSLVRSGQIGDGLAQLEQAFKADPKQSYAGLTLVTQYLKTGQAAKAMNVAAAMSKADPGNPSVLIVLASAKAQSGDANGARAAYEKALKLEPSLTQAQIGLAQLDMLAKSYDAADTRLRAMLKSNDHNPDTLLELAALSELRGKFGEAQQYLESAVDASGPSNTRANFAQVAWYLHRGNPKKALGAAKILLGKLPQDVTALQAYAGAQMANGDTLGARSTLTSAARLASFDTQTLVSIARGQVGAGDLPGAAYSLQKALQATPSDLPAQALMASVEMLQGQLDKSEQLALSIQKDFPHAAIGFELQADVTTRRGQARETIDALRKAHAVENSTRTLLRLLDALAHQADPKPAIDLAQSWLRSHPKDVLVQRALGDEFARNGNLAQARRQYEALLQQSPNDATTLNNLANVLLLQKDPGAAPIAEKALALQPQNPLVIDTAGWAAFISGNRDRSLELLRDARLRAPENGEIRFHLASVLAATGRKSEARQELQAALSGGHNFEGSAQARALLASLNLGGSISP